MPSEHNERLLEAAAVLLQEAGGSLPITSLNKALFYLDLEVLLHKGETLTQVTYLALPAGPVVAKYTTKLVAALDDAGLAEQDDRGDGSKPVYLTGEPPQRFVVGPVRAVASRIATWAKRKPASALSRFSHLNEGWKIAFTGGLGARKPAQKINMRIAMQQLIDRDPWLDEKPRGEVAEAFEAADAEAGVEW